MKGLNAKFKADPEKFLQTSGLVCSEMKTHSQVGAFKDIQGHDVREFDLVPAGRFAELKVLGGVGTYGRTSRHGSPIVGHFLHWNGQTFKAGPQSFGSIDLSSCTADYVFTAPFTGCRFVVTSQGGTLRAFHEPTEEGKTCTYGGDVVLTLGPNYQAGDSVTGCGVLVRRAGRWRAIVSTLVWGAKTATVETRDL